MDVEGESDMIINDTKSSMFHLSLEDEPIEDLGTQVS